MVRPRKAVSLEPDGVATCCLLTAEYHLVVVLREGALSGLVHSETMNYSSYSAILAVLCGLSVSLASSQQDDFDKIVVGQEFASFAEGAYQEHPSMIGEYMASDVVKRQSGLQAVTYHKEDKVVVAFAGTDFWTVADWRTNLEAASQVAKPKQFEEALTYVKEAQKKFPDASISVTGHSLGGQVALYVGGMLNIDAFAFNAPAPNLRMRAEVLAADLRSRNSEQAASVNFSSRESLMCRVGQTEDVVSDWFGGYGDTVFVPASVAGTGADGWWDVMNVYHSMSRMTQDLNKAVAAGRSAYEQTTTIWSEMSSNRSSQYTNTDVPVWTWSTNWPYPRWPDPRSQNPHSYTVTVPKYTYADGTYIYTPIKVLVTNQGFFRYEAPRFELPSYMQAR